MNLKKLSLFLIIVCVLPLLLGATTAPNQVAWEDADYLVLVHTSLYNSTWVNTLMQLKASQNLSVAVKKVVDDQTATDLKASVVRAYTTGRVPRYLLLVGDTFGSSDGVGTSAANKCFVPTFTINTEYGSTSTVAYDDEYALLAGNDDIPDLIVGRLPARSQAEISAYVNKLQEYEQASEMVESWKKKVLFVTYDFGISSTNGFKGHRFRLQARSLFGTFFARHGFDVDPLQGSDGKTANFMNATEYSNSVSDDSGRWNAFKGELNDGCLIVNVLGNSSRDNIAYFFQNESSSAHELEFEWCQISVFCGSDL